jgi:hypothetical protein
MFKEVVDGRWKIGENRQEVAVTTHDEFNVGAV